MTVHALVYWPDRRLRTPTVPVTIFNEALQELIDDMFETMIAAKGVGLAAPQIGLSHKLAVIDVTPDRSAPLCLINPEIVSQAGNALREEGCLSIPGVYEKVPRALTVVLRAQDRHGKDYERQADGLLAHCIQHELDHLNGRLFIDYLSPLKQARAQRKLEKVKRRLSQQSE